MWRDERMGRRDLSPKFASHTEEWNMANRLSVRRECPLAFTLLNPSHAWADFNIVWSLIPGLPGLKQGCLLHFSLSQQLHHSGVQLSLSSLSTRFKQKTWRTRERKAWEWGSRAAWVKKEWINKNLKSMFNSLFAHIEHVDRWHPDRVPQCFYSCLLLDSRV